jgi:hypothetical protein
LPETAGRSALALAFITVIGILAAGGTSIVTVLIAGARSDGGTVAVG